MPELTEKAAGGGGALLVLAVAVPAVAVMPRLDEINPGDLDTLRMQEVIFAGISLSAGLIASAGIDSTIPFGVAAIFTFVVVALYEYKAGGMRT